MDNIYQEGTVVMTKSNPDRKLVVSRYIKRIYYCTPIDDPHGKPLVYFERELIAPLTGQ